ncbi:hypothetical protein AAFF_G00014720 [Aldrovandia affinis]|uniref:Uncharacterized protein n=1 Tax=Aldrovandia affinis TaxID=143900 RepID=A0AAD7R4R5_9TELE|nr:hypothetical protein AAFF_G00014720 [Aldrovandia affinis]
MRRLGGRKEAPSIPLDPNPFQVLAGPEEGGLCTGMDLEPVSRSLTRIGSLMAFALFLTGLVTQPASPAPSGSIESPHSCGEPPASGVGQGLHLGLLSGPPIQPATEPMRLPSRAVPPPVESALLTPPPVRDLERKLEGETPPPSPKHERTGLSSKRHQAQDRAVVAPLPPVYHSVHPDPSGYPPRNRWYSCAGLVTRTLLPTTAILASHSTNRIAEKVPQHTRGHWTAGTPGHGGRPPHPATAHGRARPSAGGPGPGPRTPPRRDSPRRRETPFPVPHTPWDTRSWLCSRAGAGSPAPAVGPARIAIAGHARHPAPRRRSPYSRPPLRVLRTGSRRARDASLAYRALWSVASSRVAGRRTLAQEPHDRPVNRGRSLERGTT